jgi:hypothetical protein
MSGPRPLRLLAALAALAALLGGCADPAGPGTGTLTLGLRAGVGGWFQLRILDSQPDAALAGGVVFDTGCIDAKSRTYELSNIPAGIGRWVAIESFGDASCSRDGRSEVGYRGHVDIPAGGVSPYYHVPIYEVGGVTPLPEDINISAAVAAPIDFCDADAQCASHGAEFKCFDGQRPTYWCVPGCTLDADCADFHPRAECQAGTGWCVLNSPFPLNLSEPRAMGAAASLSDGSVAFVGGFGEFSGGKLRLGSTAVERFDAGLGLFVKPAITGLGTWNSALGGFVDLGGDRVVMVGGLRTTALAWSGDGDAFQLQFSGTSDQDCSGASCVPNLLTDIAVIDLAGGRAKLSTYPLPVARASLVRLNASTFLAAGGTAANVAGDGVIISDRAYLCVVAADLGVTCQEVDPLAVARTGAAATCVDAACTTVLFAGGAFSGQSPFEVARIDGGSVTFEALAAPATLTTLAQPMLCGLRLVSGQRVGAASRGLPPVELALTGSQLAANPLASDAVTALPLLPAVATLPNGDCWVSGGIDAAGATSPVAFHVTGASVLPGTLALTRGRFGAVAAAVAQGPLAGAVLVAGGVRLTGAAQAGTVDLVRGVEVVFP